MVDQLRNTTIVDDGARSPAFLFEWDGNARRVVDFRSRK
jgi:hypothetical protein